MLSSAAVKEVFARFKRLNPEPKCELNYSSDYTLLVAIVLSAQTTDKNVNKATPALFAVADTPEKMLALGEERLKTYIRSIGLFNNKAKSIIALSKDLVEKFGGKIPADFDTLQTLAGVGRKTANVVMSTAFHIPAIAVDTHVFRVSNRLGLVDAPDVLKTEMQLRALIPQDRWSDAHHWLIFHGRRVCKAQHPLCAECTLRPWCRKYNSETE